MLPLKGFLTLIEVSSSKTSKVCKSSKAGGECTDPSVKSNTAREPGK